jgi:hypothetical protein
VCASLRWSPLILLRTCQLLKGDTGTTCVSGSGRAISAGDSSLASSVAERAMWQICCCSSSHIRIRRSRCRRCMQACCCGKHGILRELCLKTKDVVCMYDVCPKASTSRINHDAICRFNHSVASSRCLFGAAPARENNRTQYTRHAFRPQGWSRSVLSSWNYAACPPS